MAVQGDSIYEFFIKKSDESVLLLSHWRTEQKTTDAKHASLQSESTFNASQRNQLTRFQIVPLNGRASFYIVDPNSPVDGIRYMIVENTTKRIGFTTIKPTDSNSEEKLYRFSFTPESLSEQQAYYIQSDNFTGENLSFQTTDVNQNLPLEFSSDPSRAVPLFANQISKTVPIKFDKDGAVVGKNVEWFKNYVLWTAVAAVVVVIICLFVLFMVYRSIKKKEENPGNMTREGGGLTEKGSFVSSGQDHLVAEVDADM